MLTLLRQIRRSLMQSGANRRYLFYALGEFILIVAGILVALQINNWNEERKEKLEVVNYLIKIHSDLQLERNNLEEFKNTIFEQKSASEYVLGYLENSNHEAFDSLKFMRSLVFSHYGVPVKRSKNVWDELESSGKSTGIKDDSLKALLFDFYSFYDSRIENFNRLAQGSKVELRGLNSQHWDGESIERWLKSDFKIYPKADVYQYIFRNTRFQELTRINIFTSFYNESWFLELKIQAEGIIDYMEENYADILNKDN